MFLYDLHTDNCEASVCIKDAGMGHRSGIQLLCTCRPHTIVSRILVKWNRNVPERLFFHKHFKPFSGLLCFTLKQKKWSCGPKSIFDWHLSIHFRVETFTAFIAICQLSYFFFNPQRGFSVICIHGNATSIIWNCCNERKQGPLSFILLRCLPWSLKTNKNEMK